MSTQSEPCSDTSVISDTQVKANAKVPTSAEAGDALDLIKELLTTGVEKLKENAKDRAELVAALVCSPLAHWCISVYLIIFRRE